MLFECSEIDCMCMKTAWRQTDTVTFRESSSQKWKRLIFCVPWPVMKIIVNPGHGSSEHLGKRIYCFVDILLFPSSCPPSVYLVLAVHSEVLWADHAHHHLQAGLAPLLLLTMTRVQQCQALLISFIWQIYDFDLHVPWQCDLSC